MSEVPPKGSCLHFYSSVRFHKKGLQYVISSRIHSRLMASIVLFEVHV